MPPVNYQSATYVARYLGVSPGSVHNWSTNPPEGFPDPDCVLYGIDNKVTARGWLPEHLPLLREWYAAKMKWDSEKAAAEWLLIDAELFKNLTVKTTQVPPSPVGEGQLTIDLEEKNDEPSA